MRLTIDLDRTRNKIKGVTGILKILFPDKEIAYRVSSSGHGGHVVVYDCGLTWDEIINYRKWLGDDKKRIEKDISRRKFGAATQVLFSGKMNLKTGEHKEAQKWYIL